MCPHDHDPNGPHPAPAATSDPQESAQPVLVEVTRGDMVESRHRGAFVVVDAEGRVMLQAGEVEALVYPRSAIKPLQALALVETGAAEAFQVSDSELALACASHNGEPAHIRTAAAWLKRIGLGPEDLECGAHLPFYEEAAQAMLRAGETPSTLHNNCSGKHTGFLTLAKHLGVPTKGYIGYSHPVQQTLLGIEEVMAGVELRDAPRGIDGCGIPQYGAPLGNLALAMARFADPASQPERRQQAVARIFKAVAANPFMLAGSGRFCTRVIEAAKGRVLLKTGAEGVFMAALPEFGLGIALKAEDGATRAAEVMMGALLQRMEALSPKQCEALQDLFTPSVINRAGLRVGEVRPAKDSILAA
ncbi:MAG: asparaginase [Rhodovibrionaceae bacterium]